MKRPLVLALTGVTLVSGWVCWHRPRLSETASPSPSPRLAQAPAPGDALLRRRSIGAEEDDVRSRSAGDRVSHFVPASAAGDAPNSPDGAPTAAAAAEQWDEAASRQRRAQAAPAPRQPLAFTEYSADPVGGPAPTPGPSVPTGLGPVLTPAQEAMADRIRDEFIAAVGGEGQDPKDPEYAARWRAAQPEADRQLRLFLGWEAYRIYQMRQPWPTISDQSTSTSRD